MKMKKENIKKYKYVYWSADKIGDQVSGTFKGFTEDKFGLNILIDNNLISMNKKSLYNVIKLNRNKFINDKSYITIKYEKTLKIQGQKNALKIYQVYLNNVLLPSTFEPVIIESDQLGKYFIEE